MQSINLTAINKTLLLPLIGRAIHSVNKNPILFDKEAIEFYNNNLIECQKFKPYCNGIYSWIWVSRALYFEKKISEHLQNNSVTVINVGAGLDTICYRINSKINWINFDLPNVIKLRQELFPNKDNIINMAGSITEEWISKIKELINNDCIFIFGGVLFYFEREKVKKIINEIKAIFPNAIILFDYISNKQLKISNSRLNELDLQNVQLKWGIDNFNDINFLFDTKYNIKTEKYFKFIKYYKKISLLNKIKMNYYDFFNNNGFAEII